MVLRGHIQASPTTSHQFHVVLSGGHLHSAQMATHVESKNHPDLERLAFSLAIFGLSNGRTTGAM